MRKALFFVVLILAGSGLASDKKMEPYRATSGKVKTTFTKEELLSAAYSDYKYPKGFYRDSAKQGEALYYINSVSIGDQNNRWKELCTDDAAEATSWDEFTDGYSSVRRFLTTMRETDRYYEFVRQDTGSTVRFRVHKCSYVDISAWDLKKQSGPLGVFNKRGYVQEDVRLLAEYLWYIRNVDDRTIAVLSSFTTKHPNRFEHTMFVLQRSVIDRLEEFREGSSSVSPREVSNMTLTRLVYRVDRKTHTINLQSKYLRSFQTLADPPEVLRKAPKARNRKGE